LDIPVKVGSQLHAEEEAEATARCSVLLLGLVSPGFLHHVVEHFKERLLLFLRHALSIIANYSLNNHLIFGDHLVAKLGVVLWLEHLHNYLDGAVLPAELAGVDERIE